MAELSGHCAVNVIETSPCRTLMKATERALSQEQIDFYSDQGYLVVDDAVPPDVIARAIRATERLLDESRNLTESNPHFDLERGHKADDPRVRRIKEPIVLDPIYRELCLSDTILDMAAE